MPRTKTTLSNGTPPESGTSLGILLLLLVVFTLGTLACFSIEDKSVDVNGPSESRHQPLEEPEEEPEEEEPEPP